MKFGVVNVTGTVSSGGVNVTMAPLVGIEMEILGVPPPLPLLLPLLLPLPLPLPPPLLLLPHANSEARTAARSPALPISCFIVASGSFLGANCCAARQPIASGCFVGRPEGFPGRKARDLATAAE
jgi:hypothetical protein